MIKLDEYISSSEGKSVSGRFLIDWTKTIEGIEKQHRNSDCLDCDIGRNCSDCVKKLKMICFNCEMERACKRA